MSQENSPDIHPTPSLIGSQVFSSPFKDIKMFSYIKSTLWIPANMSNVPVVKILKNSYHFISSNKHWVVI